MSKRPALSHSKLGVSKYLQLLFCLMLIHVSINAAAEGGGIAQTGATSKSQFELDIPNVKLLDQDGQSIRFYQDLVKDRVVGISFIFTSCTTICSPIGANVAKLQQSLKQHPEAAGFQLISISIDPVTDTPQRLKKWSAQFGREPSWTLLTGNKTQVDRLLKALRVFAPDIGDHTPLFLIGNEQKNQWKLVSAFAGAGELAKMMQTLL